MLNFCKSLAKLYIVLYNIQCLRMWRNWQTRKIQVLMVARLCRFKSCHPHQCCTRRLSKSWLPCFYFLATYVVLLPRKKGVQKHSFFLFHGFLFLRRLAVLNVEITRTCCTRQRWPKSSLLTLNHYGQISLRR